MTQKAKRKPGTGAAAAANDRRRRGTPRRDGEVLEAAVNIFHEKGYDATTIEEVANALGILKGSLYHYIDSKEDLLLRVFRDVHAKVAAIQHDVDGRGDLSPLEKLELYVQTQAEYNARNVKKIAVYYRDTGRLSEKRLREIEPMRQEHYRFVGRLLKQAQAAGEIDRSADVSVLRHAVTSTLIWIYTWYKPRGRLSPKQLGRSYGEFVLGGVRAATGR